MNQDKDNHNTAKLIIPTGEKVDDDSLRPDEAEEKQPAGKKSIAADSKVVDADGLDDDADVQSLKDSLTEKLKAGSHSEGGANTLRMILGGDILSAQVLRRNVWLIMLIVGFMILYITNRYSVQKSLLEIDKLNTQLTDAKYRALSTTSELTEECRESHILELLKNSKDSVLKIPNQPPYIINVPDK